MTDWLATADRRSPWQELRVLVTGLGVSGFAVADALLHLGAHVIVVDDKDGEAVTEKATILEILDADVRLGAGATATLPEDIDLVVTSPGWQPTATPLVAAAARGIPVWGEVELAWRLRDPERPAPWLAVTGTNGKTTVVRMLARILSASGLKAPAVGNVGEPVVASVLSPEPYDVLAVELSSYQLHWTRSMSARAAAVLNIAPDHLDWHGSLQAYALVACIYNVADPVTEQLVRDANVVTGCRAIGFTMGVPAWAWSGSSTARSSTAPSSRNAAPLRPRWQQ